MDGENGPGPLQAQELLMAFAARRGEPALRLALHAALPQVLRPELVHLLRLNFVPEAGPDAAAEADVLFAPFCEDLGNGYFRFAPQARLQLLRSLDPAYAEGPALRSVQVAGFLLSWLDRLGREAATGQDRVRADWLETERWSALAFLDAPGAARQLAAALQAATAADAVVARVRVAGLASALCAPLARYGELLAYAEGVEALERGRVDQAVGLLRALGDAELDIEGIRLQRPDALLRRVAPSRHAGRPPVDAEQPAPANTPDAAARNGLYISHCADDAAWAGVMARALEPYNLNATLHTTPSVDSAQYLELYGSSRMDELFRSVRLALVLASPAYFKESVTAHLEFPRLMEAAAGRLRLVFVTLDAVDPERIEEISRHRLLNDVRKPLRWLTGPAREHAVVEIAMGLVREYKDVVAGASILPDMDGKSGRAKSSRGLIYVSFSSKDEGKYARVFVQYLRQMIREAPELGFAEDDVYVPESVKPGNDWKAEVRSALARASIFIFLVSPEYLLSDFCLEEELRIAVEGNIRLVPIILSDCPWEGQPRPGDPQGRVLGQLQALPWDKRHQLRPIRNWRNQNAAWAMVVEQIGEMLRPRRAVQTLRSDGRSRSSMPEILPYYCGQAHIEAALKKGLAKIDRSALLIFLDGGSGDGLMNFWLRLREEFIAPHVSSQGLQLLSDRVVGGSSEGPNDSNAVIASMLKPLSIFAHSGHLSMELKGLQVVPWVAWVLNAQLSVVCSMLKSFLERLEVVSAETNLNKMVIVFLVERESTSRLSVLEWGIKSSLYKRSRIVELPALLPLSPEDIVEWYRKVEFGQYCEIGESHFLEKIMGSNKSLRLEDFNLRVRRLLKGQPLT